MTTLRHGWLLTVRFVGCALSLIPVSCWQPAYHSSFNEVTEKTIGGCLVLPLKEGVRGVVAINPAQFGEHPDLIDEAIMYFRANVLFASFELKGGADRVLVYLTLFIQQCLVRLAKVADRAEGERMLRSLAEEGISVPGEASFPVKGGLFASPAPSEREELRNYFKQLRQSLVVRLAPRVFGDDGKPNKFWLQFGKRKFMGITMA